MKMNQRVPLLDVDVASQRGVDCGLPEAMAELSVFRVALHQPEVAVALHRMLEALLFNGSLDARLRELIIMRIGWATGSAYEWTQHWRVARLLGVPENDIIAVREWETSDLFGSIEKAVLAATDDVLRDGAISDSQWSACVDAFGGDHSLLVELVAVIANWRLFSIFLRSTDVPLEEGVEAWPPDGTLPTRS